MNPSSSTPLPVVRVSLAWFPPEKLDEVARIMDYRGQPLEAAIGKLPGLISFHSGIDRQRHALVNVSFWVSVEAAEQLTTLQAMLDAGGVLTGLGAQFVRPIVNAETLWSFSPR
ncbi:MAG TPA: hypothetical protein VFI53_20990 [Myxococcaceae bacterium]|nr:hypothetical protein [Myxococcaceae bacterium]